MRRRAAFSLIELMVVIAIIGMLATVVALKMSSAMGTAKTTRVASDFKVLQDAVELYRLQTKGKLPQRLDDLVTKQIVARIPKDPWGNDYIFTLQGASAYLITTYGADGVPGGTDENQDLTTENIDKFVNGSG